VSLSLREEQDTRFHPLLAAYGHLGVALGTGDVLFKQKQGAHAQIVSRPNLVVVMIDNLDKQSIERRKRGDDGEEQRFRSAGSSGSSSDRCTLDAWPF
jgi:hypothetical protein